MRICRSDEGRELFARVLDNARYLHAGLASSVPVVEPTRLADGTELVTPVVPVVVGDDWKAAFLWKALYEAGVFVNVAIHPAVPPGGALLRTSVMATHDRRDARRGARDLRGGEAGVRGRARPAARATDLETCPISHKIRGLGQKNCALSACHRHVTLL